MNICSTCKESIHNCLDTKSFALAHLYNAEKSMAMHKHDCLEIYYSISGGRQFLIDQHFYNIQPGDIFLINQFEDHHITKLDVQPHERIIISIDPDYLKKLSTDQTDLYYCFEHRSATDPHQIRLSPNEQNLFLFLIHQFSANCGLGTDLLDKATFIQLMVFLNRCFYKKCKEDSVLPPFDGHSNLSLHVDEILSYINKHITEPLTLADLSKHFFLSSSYICRIFKSATGTTVSKYIVARRITLSKSFLNSGYSVAEACEACGFTDYSNYFKAFTKIVGISPKKYSLHNNWYDST